MNDVVFKTLKGKDFIVKNYLLKVAVELRLSLNEMILLIYFMNQEEPTLNIENISSSVYLSEEEIMEAFTRLVGINLISMNVIKAKDGTRSEIISCDNVIKHVSSELAKEHKKEKKSNLFEIFESEFGRGLSPMEYEIIDDWLRQGMNEELIEEALREATLNNAKSLRYISKILLTWQEKGYKSKHDIVRGYKKESESSASADLFDYNWLENE